VDLDTFAAVAGATSYTRAAAADLAALPTPAARHARATSAQAVPRPTRSVVRARKGPALSPRRETLPGTGQATRTRPGLEPSRA